MKLTTTEGVILAELLLKMAEDELLAHEIADVIHAMIEKPRLVCYNPADLVEENLFYVGGRGFE